MWTCVRFDFRLFQLTENWANWRQNSGDMVLVSCTCAPKWGGAEHGVRQKSLLICKEINIVHLFKATFFFLKQLVTSVSQNCVFAQSGK